MFVPIRLVYRPRASSDSRQGIELFLVGVPHRREYSCEVLRVPCRLCVLRTVRTFTFAGGQEPGASTRPQATPIFGATALRIADGYPGATSNPEPEAVAIASWDPWGMSSRIASSSRPAGLPASPFCAAPRPIPAGSKGKLLDTWEFVKARKPGRKRTRPAGARHG